MECDGVPRTLEGFPANLKPLIYLWVHGGEEYYMPPIVDQVLCIGVGACYDRGPLANLDDDGL